MVNQDGLVDKLVVTADGTGQVGHAGSALLAGAADRIGLTAALSQAMASTRERRSVHDPGVVLRDLIVCLADGGDCLSDLGALRDQRDLFGGVASDSTAFRVIDSIDEQCLARLREGDRGGARARVGARRSPAGDRARHRRDPDDGALRQGAGRRQLQGWLWPPSAVVLSRRKRRGPGGCAAARQRGVEHRLRSHRGARRGAGPARPRGAARRDPRARGWRRRLASGDALVSRREDRLLGRLRSRRARGSSSGCATDWPTSRGGSPATRARRSCASRATGPGQASSPPPSRACGRCPLPPASWPCPRHPTSSSRPTPAAGLPANRPQPAGNHPQPPLPRAGGPTQPHHAPQNSSQPLRRPGQPLTASGTDQTLGA